MNAPLRTWTAVALAVMVPATALAQSGKIDDVERSARSGGGRPDSGHDHDHDDGCNILCALVRGIVHGPSDAVHRPDSAEPPTQTYGRYPWGGPRLDQAFVTRGPRYRPNFGVASVSWFKDATSTLSGMSMAIEGGIQEGYLRFDATVYGEETPTDTDYLTTLRGEIGGVMPVGRGFMTVGIGARMACLDTDVCAYGGDLALGARVLPVRPLVLSGHASLGPMKWHDGDWYLATEYTTTASVVLGRVEVGGGWHWLKLGGANAFGGPILIGRVWF